MNSVAFIDDYFGAGIDLALCAARPNWDEPMQVEATMPTFVTTGLSGRESRHCRAATNRYTFEYLFESFDAADSTDMRLWLNRLKDETVAVPLWPDQVILSAACSAGAVSLSKTSPAPVRSGSRWLILDPDGFNFEIVTVDALTPATMTLHSPGTQYAWPAGTTLYPLLFGRLSERPEFEALTDEHLSGRLKFKESSSFDYQLAPYTAFLPTVGSHIPDFSAYRLWNLPANHERMLDRTEADILYKEIGFGREEFSYAFPNWNRRGLEMEFLCDSRTDMAFIEKLFYNRRATTYPFFIPTFRGDLKLAADVASGDSTFEIENSRYEIGSYDDHPGSAFMAFVDSSGVYPQRIIEVEETTIHTQVAIGEAHSRLTTKVSYFMLVRFAEPKITWSYDSDGIATARIKFIEVADEYVTPNAALYEKAFGCHFEETLPNGTTNEWFFTSFEDEITSSGDTYLPGPISHTGYSRDLEFGNSMELVSWGGNFPNNPLNRFLPYTFNAQLKVTLSKFNLDGSSARILWSGYVQKLNTKGRDWTAECGLSAKFNQSVPTPEFKSDDNLSIFDPASGIDPNDYKVTGTIASISGMTITVTGSNKPDDWFSQGYLDTGAAGHGEGRSILKSTVSGTTQTLTIDRPFFYGVVGQSIDLFAGYDGTIDQRETKFGDRPGAFCHPFIPPSNPSAKGPDVAAPTGGKKG